MRSETITDTGIYLYTEKASCAELDMYDIDLLKDLGCELVDPVFWFSRLKAKVEGQGEGTKLMERLVQILDEKGITVVNGVNPYGSMKMKDLVAFYERYDFVMIKDGIMVRYPKKSL